MANRVEGGGLPSLFWPGGIVAAFLFSLAGLLVAQHVSDRPILFEAVPPNEREAVYNAAAGASGALLGFVIAALSALLAVRGSAFNEGRAWREIPGLLLAAAVFMALTLVFSITALSADGSADPSSGFIAVWSATVVAASVALALGLAAFGLAVATVITDDSA